MKMIPILSFCLLLSTISYIGVEGQIKPGQYGCSKSGDCVQYARCWHPHQGSRPDINRCDCMPGFTQNGDTCICNRIISCSRENPSKCTCGECDKSSDCGRGAQCYHPGEKDQNSVTRCDCFPLFIRGPGRDCSCAPPNKEFCGIDGKCTCGGCHNSGDCPNGARCFHPTDKTKPTRCDCQLGFEAQKSDGSCACKPPNKLNCETKENCWCGQVAHWRSKCETDDNCVDGAFCLKRGGNPACRCCSGPIWGVNDNGQCPRRRGNGKCPNNAPRRASISWLMLLLPLLIIVA